MTVRGKKLELHQSQPRIRIPTVPPRIAPAKQPMLIVAPKRSDSESFNTASPLGPLIIPAKFITCLKSHVQTSLLD